VRVRDRVITPVGGDRREPVLLAQPDDQIPGARAVDTAAHDEQRALGLAQEPDGIANGGGMRRHGVSDAIRRRRQRIGLRERLAQHVARDLDQHRTAPARHGRPQRRAEQVGDAVGPRDLKRELRHRLEHRDQVVFLEGVLLRVVERDAADQDDHRRVRHVRSRHAGEQVGRAGAAGDQAHTRQIRHP
jgi:hypothetical protein